MPDIAPKDHRAPFWVVPVMRFGYAARGVTYVILAGLIVLAAWQGGSAGGTKQALASLRGQHYGLTALWVLAAGFLSYAVWRFIAAGMDLEDHGAGAKGLAARTGLVITGAIHLGLAASATRLALGGATGGQDGQATQSMASWLLQQPYGRQIVMGVALVVVGAGLYYGWKGISEKYKQYLKSSRVAEALDPAAKAGLVAQGCVIAIAGIFLFFAGLHADPSQAGGVSRAFDAVRAQPFGRILLGLLGLGMLGFAIYCFIEAAYRFVPRRSGPDVPTLASRAKAHARQESRKVVSQLG